MKSSNRIYKLTIRAVLMAVIVLQVAIPFLGYIPINPLLSITTLHVTVIVAAIVLGTKDGMLVGFMWGTATFIRALTAPSGPIDILIFTNPLISILPRIVVGLVAGLVFNVLYKKMKKVNLAAIVSAALATLTNTVLVLGSMALFYTEIFNNNFNTDSSNIFKALGIIVVTNGLPEIIFACIAVPLIVRAIFAATKLKPDLRE